MKYVILWVRMFFAGHMLVSALNYYFEFLPLPPIESSPAGPFVVQIMHNGIYAFIKAIELVAGLGLLLNVAVPLALVLEFPVTLTIFYLAVFVVGSGRPVYAGTRELLFHLFLFAAYGSYYVDLFKLRAQVEPIWHPAQWSRFRQRLTLSPASPQS